MGKKRKNPFKPGAGKTPPVRAGHEEAAHDLSRRVDDVCDRKEGEGDTVILYGPRGTGKTTLLLEVKAQATRGGAWVRRLTPVDWKGTVDDFVRNLPVGIATKTKVKVTIKVDLGPFRADAEHGPGQGEYQLVEQVLHQLASKKALVLLVDEAHRLPPDIGEVLLNAAQNCLGDGLPLLVVLAGTPGVRANLSRVGASFWERSHRLAIGRLESPDAVREALSLPAKRQGLPFTKDALELLVADSQGYPFFIQLLGAHAWEAAIKRDPATDHIRLEDARVGMRMATKQREGLCNDRLLEVNTRKIKSEALAVSKAFSGRDDGTVLSRRELGVALKPALTGGRSVDDAIQELFALGLIWETGSSSWEQGIPSLCTHLAEHVVID